MEEQKKSWTTRHYILAALGATLAATAIVMIVSMVLSPAHITFSVARAWRSTDEDGKADLKLTITASNGSRGRVKVKYQSLFVDLKNSTSPDGKDTIHAQVDPRPDSNQYLLPGEPPVNFTASALLVDGDWLQDFDAGSRDWLTVVVMAQVRFKVGAVPTRLYDIKVSCPKVLFPKEGSPPGGAAQWPVNCTG